jgi:E3 ubiquitin-protein ligase HERC3
LRPGTHSSGNADFEDSGGGFGALVAHGDEPGEMGDSLPAISLGEGRSARVLKSGYGVSCALLEG